MEDYSKFYKELNPSQRAAVDTIDGPVLVLAGPGTGKTQLLSIRAAAILKAKKAGPENILILTYTNSAAKAMKERLARIIGPEGYDIEVGTFHSFANSIIQESEEAVDYVGDKIQMNEIEQVRAVEYALDHAEGAGEIRPFGAPYLYLSEIMKRIGELKRDGVRPRDFEDYLKRNKASLAYLEEKHSKRLRALSAVYKMYEETKEGGMKDIFDERGRYDFDDMIIFATEALKKERELREKCGKVYRYVMVDEYQDTNGAQLEFLFTLLDYKEPNLCCVGDDDQSIYRFQGASVGNFKLLKKRFPGIKVLNLKENYRSTKELIDASSRIINLIPLEERMTDKILAPVKDYADKEIEFREFTTETEELIYIVDKVRELKERITRDKTLGPPEERAHAYNNIAVLVRKRRDILTVIDAFLKAGIPYATDGKEDIGGEKRVKQLLDVLELAHIEPSDRDARDMVLYRILASDYLEIPHVDILRFVNHVNMKREKERKRDISVLSEFLEYFSSENNSIKFDFKPRMARAALAIKRLLDDAETRTVHMILMDFIKDSGLFKYILRAYAERDILRIRELRSVTSFVNMVKNADIASPAIRLKDFMEEMKTRKEHNLPIQGNLVTMMQDGVRVFTAHGSKGLEFHSVIIPFCLQNKNWPARPLTERILLPSEIFKARERPKGKELSKQLYLNDETRLFYVAMTRAKSNLIFTASPGEDSVSSFYLTGLDIQRESPDSRVEEEVVLIKSMETADPKDPFIGTEAVLKDMVASLSLNPTRLNNYLTCRRKFLYNDVLKLPGQKKRSLVFGNCVHKALEETYAEYKTKKAFPAFKYFRDAFEAELKFQGVDRSIELHCLGPGQIAKVKGWFDLASRNPVMPIDLEKKLIITVGDGIIFTGKYDKVEWLDERRKTVRILDYKTGKPDDHLKAIHSSSDITSETCDGYLRQLVAYKLLFEKDKRESGGRKVGCGSLVFIEPVYSDMRRLGHRKGDYVTKDIDISDDMVARLEDIIKDVWGNIKKLQFQKLPERDKNKCGKCDFDNLCWE